jgi:serine/threonine-protein kinase
VLKVADRGGASARTAAELLAREAEAGRAASHPNLVSILSAQLDAPPPYVVMPRLEGTTLSAALAKHPVIPPAHALWIARQAAEGLCALHASGWRHGDVKPANIIISSQGHATLIDLGFCCRIDQPRATLFQAHLGGTYAYGAPELFTSACPVAAESDVYSLGVTLFEMFAGRRPFLESDPVDLAAAHLHQIPPNPRAFAPHLHPRISWLLARMLAKEPLRRPTSAELVVLLAELEIETFVERSW